MDRGRNETVTGDSQLKRISGNYREIGQRGKCRQAAH